MRPVAHAKKRIAIVIFAALLFVINECKSPFRLSFVASHSPPLILEYIRIVGPREEDSKCLVKSKLMILRYILWGIFFIRTSWRFCYDVLQVY
ncbi:hypothetical protein DFH29DRAFT_944528 [Suillus ampliporus]|nr:hypothetical protein DFH29DRAFT_944528 [Suillus ampliporus]